MQEPRTKTQVLAAIRDEHTQMEELLAGLAESELTAPLLDAGWSVKDSLAHLVAWEKLMLGWVESSMRGVQPVVYTPEFVAPDDKAQEEAGPRLNDHIFQENRERALDDVLADFRRTHEEVVKEIELLSEDDIFGPDRFPWRKGKPLLTTIAGNTYGHYEEHIGWIRAGVNPRAKGLPDTSTLTPF